ncbi:hypothetical protein WJX75_005762 [Coccomyxa subellipsoidea]|uniref:40S ribosomal protein S25 n=1 Tax=Coccomyxa subellipsoidea TaxID=248742 RepID=A0ABR2YKM3_9CHLO
MPKDINPFRGKRTLGNNNNKAPRRGRKDKSKGPRKANASPWSLMDCRHISKEDVLASLRRGTLNERKSNMRQLPCPKYVVDATLGLKAKKNVQAVFSACPTHTDVITVIDKDTNWECYCP